MAVLLDTSDVAPAERAALWSQSASQLFAPMDVQPLHERPFAGRILGHHLGPIDVLRVAGDAHRVRRTVADVVQHDPERLHVSLLTRGALLIGQDGRSCRLRAGDMTSIDTSRPFVAKANARFEILTFTIPKSMLGDHVDEIITRTATRLPGDTGLTRVAGPFFVGVAAGLHDGSIDADDPYLAESIVGLVRALHGDRPVLAPARGRELVRAEGLRDQIVDFIELHLREPDLGPERIARAHFISTRYVHKLFRPGGTTVAAYIRTRRLEGARRDLADRALAGQTIGSLATSWGFGDPARFSRAFRAVYGCSPTEARTLPTPRSPDWP
jgi:AraC-like DNA-binding protein